MSTLFKVFFAIFVFIITLGFFLSAVLAFDIQQEKNLFLCFDPGCINYAFEVFSPSISILESTLQLAGGFAVCWGVVISSITYRDNAIRLKESDAQQHYENFRQILKDHPLHSMVRDPVEAEKTIYNAIFKENGPRTGSLTDQFNRTVSELHEYLRINHPLLGEDNRKTTETSYNKILNKYFNAMGIIFQNSRNCDIKPNSSAVFDFVDKICSDCPHVPRLSSYTTGE